MGYIIDALFFRLKFTKSWFYIGFVRKKFYSYLIALQANIFNYLIFIFTRDLNINRQGFYLSSIKLIQKHSYFVLLLLGKISLNSTLLKSSKNRLFDIDQGFGSYNSFPNDNSLTHHMIRLVRGYRLLKVKPAFKDISYLFYINKLFDFNSVHLLSKSSSLSPVLSPLTQVHLSSSVNFFREAFSSFIISKQRLFSPMNYNLNSFWLKILTFSKKKNFKLIRRKLYRLFSYYRIVSTSKKKYKKIFRFFKHYLPDNLLHFSSKYYLKNLFFTKKHKMLRTPSFSNFWKKFMIKFISFSNRNINAFYKFLIQSKEKKPTFYFRRKRLLKNNFFNRLFKFNLRKKRFVTPKTKNFLLFKSKILKLLRLRYLKFNSSNKNKAKSSKIIENYSLNLTKFFTQISNLFIKNFFLILSSDLFSILSLSDKIKLINSNIILHFKDLLLKNFDLFDVLTINYFRTFIVNLTKNFLLQSIKFLKNRFQIHFVYTILKILKIFQSIESWYDNPRTPIRFMFPRLVKKHIKPIILKKKTKRIVLKKNIKRITLKKTTKPIILKKKNSKTLNVKKKYKKKNKIK